MALMIIAYVLSFLVFGILASLVLQAKKLVPKEFVFVAGIASSLLLYYAIFYLYPYNPAAAHDTVLTIILLSAGALFFLIYLLVKNPSVLSTVKKYYLPPFIITLFIFAAYSTLFYGCQSSSHSLGGYDEVSNAGFCHIRNLPFDNALPFIYAENVLNNEDEKLAIDWTIADRPPLQIAATLPIEDFTQGQNQYQRFYYYHLFSVFLQLSWVGAVWAILQRLKIKRRGQALILAGFSLTGFFYLNSVFIWPKLLSAAMVLSAVALFIGQTSKKFSYNYLPFAALLVALGLLSHSGVLFTLVPFAALIIYKVTRSQNIGYKYLLISLLLGLAILAPWQIFKGTVTSSDRLVKYHFAGIHAHEDKRGTLRTIVDEYRATNFAQWQHRKIQNVKALVSGNLSPSKDCPIKINTLFSGCNLLQWRTVTFYSTLFALEIFTLGLFLLLFGLLRKQWDAFDKEAIFIISGSMVFWVLAMFESGGTVVHQGSYATMMLLFVLLARQLTRLPYVTLGFLVGFQALIFYFVWIGYFLPD